MRQWAATARTGDWLQNRGDQGIQCLCGVTPRFFRTRMLPVHDPWADGGG